MSNQAAAVQGTDSKSGSHITSNEIKDCYDNESLRNVVEVNGNKPLSACAQKIVASRGLTLV